MFGWIQSGYSNTAFSNVESNDIIMRTERSNAKIVLGTGKDPSRNATVYITQDALGINSVPSANTVFDVSSVLSVLTNSNVSVSTTLRTPIIEVSSNIVSSNVITTQLNVSSNITASNIQTPSFTTSNATVKSLTITESFLPLTPITTQLGNVNVPFADAFLGQSNSLHIGDVSITQDSNIQGLRIHSHDDNTLRNVIASGFQVGDSNPLLFTRSNNEGPLLLFAKDNNGDLYSIPIIENIWSSNQKIGIGRSTPSETLDIDGNAIVRGAIKLSSGASAIQESNTVLLLNGDNTFSNVILNGQQVTVVNNLGVGTSNPQYSLDVPGIARLRNVLLSQNQLPFLVYNEYADIEQNIPYYGLSVPSTSSNFFVSGKNGITLLTSNASIVIHEKARGLGIKTSNVNGQLQFANGDDFRKIVLAEKNNNSHEVVSVGTTENSNMVFQIPGSNGNFKYYVAEDSSSSKDIFTISGKGNVRIGSTSLSYPTEKLEIEGNLKVDGTLRFGDTIDTTTGRFMSVGYPLLQPGNRVSLAMGKTTSACNQAEISYIHIGDNSPSNVLLLGHNTVDVLSVTGYGGVGIGTSNPQYKLDVKGTIFASGDIITECNLIVQSNIITNEIQSVTGHLKLGTNELTDTITIGGNNQNITTINIGGPGDVINLQGDVSYVQVANTVITDNSIVLNKGGIDAIGSGFEIERNGIIEGYIKASSSETGFDIKPPLSSNVFEIDVSPSSMRASINKAVHFSYSNSNVGIGTATNTLYPSASLHVSKGSNTTFTLETLSNDFVTFTLENSDVRWQMFGPYYESNNALLVSAYDKGRSLNSIPYLAITSDGKIGILKDNPEFELDVAGTINATAVLVNGQPISANAGSPGGGTGAGWAVAGTKIFSYSNIGISTSNPIYNLDVDGLVNANGFLVNGSPFTAGYWSTCNDVMYSLSNIGIGLDVPQYNLDVAGTINATNILVNGQNISSGFWQINAGSIYSLCNVGIGTSTPSRRLDVVGDARVLGDQTVTGKITTNTLEVSSNVLISGSITVSKPLSISSTQWGDGIIFNDGNNRIYTDVSDTQLVISIDDGSNLLIKNATGCNLLKIIGSNGQITIGDINPGTHSATLSIQGAVSASGYCNLTWSMIANSPIFATVAMSGSYDDLTNKPALCNVAFTGRFVDLIGAPSLTGLFATQSWNDLLNKPSFSVVAYSGNFSDLNNLPSFCNIATTGKWEDIYELPTNLSQFGINDLSNFSQTTIFQQNVGIGVVTPETALDVQGAIRATSYCNISYNELINRPTLCNVATTGDFTQLNNYPGLSFFNNDINYFECNVGIKQLNPSYTLHVNGTIYATSYCNIDWSMIKNTPELTRPSWIDIDDSPSNLSFFTNDLSNFGVITATSYCNLSWSMINSIPSFCNIATTASWLDIANRPVNLSSFLNDLSFFECNVGIGVSPSSEYALFVQGPINATSYCNMTWGMISSKPNFAQVATTGSFGDLINKPISLSEFTNDLSNFTAPSVRFNGSVGIGKEPTTTFDVNGTISATGYCNLDWSMIENRPTFNGDYNNLTNLPQFSTVAYSGTFNDLIDIPTFCNVSFTAKYGDLLEAPQLSPLAYINSNLWENINNKPVFSTIATTGEYTDLLNKPYFLTSFSNDLTTLGNIHIISNLTVSSNTIIHGKVTVSNDVIVDGLFQTTQGIKTTSFTALDNNNTLDIGNSSNVTNINIGVCDDVTHIINIGTGTPVLGTCNIIRLGNATDQVLVPGTWQRTHITDTYTSNRTFTMNVGGADAGGVGIFMEENSNNTAYIKISNDRKSFLMKTPLSITDAVFNLSSNSINLNESLTITSDTSNVGIGTSNPIEKLHIEKGHIRLHNQNNVIGRCNVLLLSHVSPEITSQISSYYWTDAGNSNVDLQFYTYHNSPVANMYLRQDKVGIGMSNPLTKLHVDGDISFKQALLFRVDSTHGWSNGTNKTIDIPGSNMLALYTPSATLCNPCMTLSNGFVSIGKTQPTASLDVEGSIIASCNINLERVLTIGPSLETIQGQRVRIGTTGSNSQYHTLLSMYAPNSSILVGNSNELITMEVYGKTVFAMSNTIVNENLIETRGNALIHGILTASNINSCNITTIASNLNTITTSLEATSNQAYSVSGKWSVDGADTYYTLGKVGVGKANPIYTLDVNGTLNATTYCNVDWTMIQNAPQLSIMAYENSNTYNNLLDAPALCNIALSGQWSDIDNKPNFSTLATTGDWVDVQNRPISLSEFTNNLTTFSQQVVFNDRIGIGVANPGYELDVSGTINASNILINGSNLSSVIPAGYWITNAGYQTSVSNIIVGANTIPSANFQATQDVLISACNHSWSTTAPKGIYMRYSTFDTEDAAYIQSITRTTNQLHNMFINGSNITIGTNSGPLYVRHNGRIGIGTSNPTETFEVIGSISAVSYCNIAYNSINGRPTLSIMAYENSNTYDNILDRPNLSPLAFFGSNTWTNIQDKPQFANIAFDGAWSNLQGIRPALSIFTNDLNAFNQLTTFNSNIQLANSTNGRKIALFNTQTTNHHQFFGFGVLAGTLRYQVDSSTSDHGFFSGNTSSTSIELMRIKGNGNVGVGTSDPVSKLHVSAGSIRIDGSAAPSLSLITNDNGAGTTDITFLRNAGDGFRMKTFSDSNAFTISQVEVGGAETSRIWVGTNVGIKTTNPIYDLHINGSVFATSYCNIQWSQITGLPTFLSQPFSGSYTDLTDKPVLLSSFTNDISTFVQDVIFSSNVGIGVPVPSCELDVSGGLIKATSLQLSSGVLALSTLTSTLGTFSLASDNGTSTINIGCPSTTQNTINIGTTTPISLINIGNNADTTVITSSSVMIATPQLSTNSKILTLNSAGTLESGGSCGIQIFENSNATGYMRVSADRSSFEMKTPLGSEMNINLTGNAVNINNNALWIGGNGTVGIGTNTPSQALEVIGSVRCAAVLTTSDVRKKKNISHLESALDKLHNIRGVYYDWIEPPPTTNTQKRNVGVIAQEVEKVLPEAVQHDETTDTYSVDYQAIVALLINAVKEQQKVIEELKNMILSM